ncbi:DUF429 domain-containing protein [Massilia sp. TS11]|uniref:DUF429 domain-containing protein n=1 Tax=Massilia sp. TS11 TaxID=2908003 RepID=UPI001EDA6486|nr:DUF429 domain-containing protein [Massilia sp. TS11]
MNLPAVAGVDIGGEKKGCNLVILAGTTLRLVAGRLAPAEVGPLCVAHGAVLVGVDAPSQWSDGAPRLAERELARAGISCFSTPTRARAETVAFFRWMLSGEGVYQSLAPSHPLLGAEAWVDGPACFETFPHAIACALLGRAQTSAKLKRPQRSAVLAAHGIDTAALRNMDDLDAAMCALAAQYLLRGQARSFGDAAGGRIFVPAA